MGVFSGILAGIVKIVSQILVQLKADETVYYQLAIFIFAISYLTIFVFAPYFKAADQRLNKTKGADTVAKEAALEAKNLEAIYLSKAREINNTIKSIFDAEKSQAQIKAQDILSAAKLKADQEASSQRAQIKAQVAAAESQIAEIASDVAQTLKSKFEKGL